jgi:hypothetical protein
MSRSLRDGRRAACLIGRMNSPKDFNEILLEAVDYSLLVLGEIVRVAIYERIERSHGVRHDEIPEKLKIFDKGLQQLLGASSKVMERLIAKRLYNQLTLNFTTHQDWTLVDYVNHAKMIREEDSNENA